MLQEFFVINCKISMHGDVWLVFNSTAVNFAKGQAMSSNDTGTPPHTPVNGAQPAPLEAKALQDKNMERLRGYASFSYQLVIAVGAVITFAYLFSINFFPVGLTAGEVVLFVFIALAFGFVYSIFWLYGTFSALWAFQTVLWIVYKLRTLYHSLLHERRPRSDIYLLHTARWRPGKRWQPTRIRRPQRKNIAADSQKMLLPPCFSRLLARSIFLDDVYADGRRRFFQSERSFHGVPGGLLFFGNFHFTVFMDIFKYSEVSRWQGAWCCAILFCSWLGLCRIPIGHSHIFYWCKSVAVSGFRRHRHQDAQCQH